MNDVQRIIQIISSKLDVDIWLDSLLEETAEEILNYVDVERTFSSNTPGNWHIWNGGPRPVPPDFLVQVQLRDNSQGTLFASDWNWEWAPDNPMGDIIAYRVVKIEGAGSVN